MSSRFSSDQGAKVQEYFVYFKLLQRRARRKSADGRRCWINQRFLKAGDALTDGLTEKQKELFEDLMTARREVNVLTDCETFCQAFKLGAKIILDVLTEGQMREI